MEAERKALTDARAIGETNNFQQHKDTQNSVNQQDCGDYFEVVDYLQKTAGLTLYGAGRDDNKVLQQTEAKIAALLIRYLCAYGDDAPVRWESLDTFRFWTGTHWKSGDSEAMKHIVKRFLAAVEAGEIYRYFSSARIAKEILSELCQHADKQYVPTTEYLGFKNGVLNLQTLELMAHTKELMPKFTINYNYNKEADCPMFEKCISDALDADTQNVFQELCGNLLMGYKHEVIGILVGSGNNGKSTILEALTAALGEEDVTSYNLAQITESDGRYVANMENKIANITFDSSQTLKIGNENILKSYCSGEPLLAKTLYKQPRMTRNYPKSLIGLNNLPSTTDYSHGFFRRLKIVPFAKTIPSEKMDLNMKDTLKSERAGILNWLISGMVRLKQNGRFSNSEPMRRAENAYRLDADTVASWADEAGYEPSWQTGAALSEMFGEFQQWQIRGNYQPMTVKKFAARLRGLGYRTDKIGGVLRVFAERNCGILQDGMPF